LDGVFDKVSERKYGIIARGCFGGGALKQSLTEAELRAIEQKWERVLQIRRLAERMQRSPLEAALQFSLSIERISVTILGMRTPEHLAANLQYYSARPMSNDEKHELLAYQREGLAQVNDAQVNESF
jgi:aryl-alcohol dehydrogenase-like predicted oxidoreductase